MFAIGSGCALSLHDVVFCLDLIWNDALSKLIIYLGAFDGSLPLRMAITNFEYPRKPIPLLADHMLIHIQRDASVVRRPVDRRLFFSKHDNSVQWSDRQDSRQCPNGRCGRLERGDVQRVLRARYSDIEFIRHNLRDQRECIRIVHCFPVCLEPSTGFAQRIGHCWYNHPMLVRSHVQQEVATFRSLASGTRGGATHDIRDVLHNVAGIAVLIVFGCLVVSVALMVRASPVTRTVRIDSDIALPLIPLHVVKLGHFRSVKVSANSAAYGSNSSTRSLTVIHGDLTVLA